MGQFLIGQRVILNNSEIGVVVKPENSYSPTDSVWVYSPSKDYSSAYSYGNVKPLPGGQL